MQIPITGQAYAHPSQDVNNQRCVNFFPTTGGDNGRGQVVLLETPGLKSLVDLGGATDVVRGLCTFDDNLYAVINNTFYLVTITKATESAILTSKGTLTSVLMTRVRMKRNATQVMIVDDNDNAWTYTVGTNTFAEVTDVDFLGAGSLAYIDNYFFYNRPGTDDIYATDIGDGSAISALDVVSAEAYPDVLVGLGVDKRELWAFGTNSIEVYYNAANPAGFPFSIREGAGADIGCSARDSIVSVSNSLMWLDSRRYIVKSAGYDVEVVSTEPINNAISNYDTVEDAYAFRYTELGHTFYVISFPTEEQTWVYDTTSGGWHEWAYWDSTTYTYTHHLANCYVYFDGWHIVGDRQSGNIYRLSREYFDDDGAIIRRLRTTPFLNDEFKNTTINELELMVEAGKGTTTGTGSDPQITLRYSNDGGYTWSNEMTRSIGQLGQYGKRVRWNRLGMAHEWIFEFVMHDPVSFCLIDASVEIASE